jgi:DNA repair exonuclease SbcCD ATPase subunit
MILKYLYAENAGNYDKFEYRFKEGITLINGKNLSGKSTVLDIIRFSIYANCAKSRKIQNFIKRGKKKPTLKTKIEFEFKGNLWVINREYSGKNVSATLEIDKDIKATSADTVSKYLQDNFVSESFLINSNLAQQRETDGLLNVKPAARLEIQKKIFDLDIYKKIAGVIYKDIKETETGIDKLKGEKQVVEEEIKDSQEYIDSVDIDSLTKEKETSKTGLKGFNTQRDNLISKKTTIEGDIENINLKNVAIKEVNKLIDSLLLGVENCNQRIEEKEKEIKSEQEQIKEYNGNKLSLTTKIEDTKNSLKESVLVRVPVFDVKDLESMREEKLKCEIAYKNNSDDIKLIDEGKCPKCGRDFEEKDISHKNELIDRNIGIKSKLIVFDKEIKRKELERENVEKTKEMNDKIKEKQNEIKNLIVTLESEFTQVDSKIEICNNNITNYKQEIERARNDIETATKQLEGKSPKKLIDSTELETFLKITETELSKVDSIITKHDQELNDLQEKIKKYEDHNTRVDSLVKKVKDVEDKILHNTKYINDLSETRNIYEKKLPLFMMLKKLTFVAQESNKFLHKVFNKYDISFEQVKDSLDIIFTDNVTGEKSPIENLSGFEYGVGSIAIRVGYALYNSLMNRMPVCWVGLDEPDAFFEEERSELFFNALFEMIKEFKQLLVVTHKPTVKDTLYSADVINIKNNGANSYIEDD